MKGLKLWVLGLIPLAALAMLAMGVVQGIVPFTHLQIIGVGLISGALLLGTGVAGNLRRDALRSVLFWFVVVMMLAEGAAGLWFLGNPDGAGAVLVRANPERMGESLTFYVDHFGENEHLDGLVDDLLDDAPYAQVVAFHLAHRDLSAAREAPDRFVTRLSHEPPAVILAELDGAHQAFGNDDGQLAPLAAVLDQHSLDLDHAALAVNLPLLAGIAPPGSPYSRLGTQLGIVAAEEVEVAYDVLRPGDRVLADLVIHARDHGNHTVQLDASGAPAGLDVLTDEFLRLYLLPISGGGGGKVIRLRYRELREGDIVETADGPRPVDIVTAELFLRVELDGEVRHDRTYRGVSPMDAWQGRTEDTSLREHYRLAALAALNEQLFEDFERIQVR